VTIETRDRISKWGWGLFATWLVIVLAIYMFVIPIRAVLGHEHGQLRNPELSRWTKGLKDKDGTGCCDSKAPYPAKVRWNTNGDHNEVFIENKWVAVSPEALLTRQITSPCYLRARDDRLVGPLAAKPDAVRA
jgi:hypothetical protein